MYIYEINMDSDTLADEGQGQYHTFEEWLYSGEEVYDCEYL